MISAVFFDLDGTLLDTVPGIMSALNGVLARYGYPLVTEQDTRAFVGNGAKKLVERAVPPWAPVEKILMEFRADYAKYAHASTREYADMGGLISVLKAKGVKLAVITNKPQEATMGCLNAFFPEGTFDFVGGDSGAFPVKPDPALTRYAALTLRVAPRDCVFVGDGETDVLTAKNAGMRSVSVLWGYRSRNQLEAAGATLFAESPAELLKLFENF